MIFTFTKMPEVNQYILVPKLYLTEYLTLVKSVL